MEVHVYTNQQCTMTGGRSVYRDIWDGVHVYTNQQCTMTGGRSVYRDIWDGVHVSQTNHVK